MTSKEVSKIIVSFIIAIFLISPVFAVADVAYLYRANFKIDNNIINTFKEMNLSVDLINERSLPSSFSQYRFLFIGDENFFNNNKIPVDKKATIIANYYNADDFGLTDREGVSQLGSSDPLSVVLNGHPTQVYTQAFSRDRRAIPYYYLDKEDKASSVMQIAGTETTSSGKKYGDVIGYVNASSILANRKVAQGNICFFGIVESDYWTPAAKNLFKDCVGFVASTCSTNSQCPANQTSSNFCKEGSVYKTQTSYSCVNPATISAQCAPNNNDVLVEACQFGCENAVCLQGFHDISLTNISNTKGAIEFENTSGGDITSAVLQCNTDYKVDIKVLNKGNFTENITYLGSAGNISFSHISTNNLAPQDTTAKSKTVNFALPEGYYNVTVQAVIANDSFPIDNTAKKQIFISCPAPVITCSTNSQCGVDSYTGEIFCSEKNITQNFITYTCNNAGLVSSFCSNSTAPKTKEVCSNLCSNGECTAPPLCSTNSDCADNNPKTFDECINSNTTIAQCRHTEINCASNLDCGSSGFTGNEFCSNTNVSKNFINYVCQNAGTLNSSCLATVGPQIVSQCQYACTEGQCIRCSTNSQCSDNNPTTTDICNLPGTIQSYCTNIINITQPIIPCSSNNECNDNMNNTEDICNNPGLPSSFCTNNNITCFTNLDCGINGFINTPFCKANNITQSFKTFTCNNPGTAQSSCSSSISNQTKQICSQSCSEGQCVSVECSTNSQCNDSNPKTYDECINPGTPISDCRNTPINCASNLDCGTSGLIGSEFCSSNNVSKNLITYTCNNPGTLNSSCTSVTNPQTILSCQYSCSEGQCIRCATNSQCGDNNSTTLDICNNAGTIQSFCTNRVQINQPIECFANSDCGNTTVISDNFCSSNDVKKLVKTYSCNNAGLPTAYCSSSIQQQLVQSCSNLCSDGQCVNIACSTNSQCNDNNSSTLDLCNLPRTPQSFCTNNPIEITCSSNSDCGVSGFINSPFCSMNNVTQMFQNFTCSNPGLPSSFCSTSISPVTKQICSQVCSNGQCISQSICGNGILESPEQCDDGNSINGDSCSSQCIITTQCSDGIDNDGDGRIDLADPNCDNPNDNNESPELSALVCTATINACGLDRIELMQLSSLQNGHASIPDFHYPYHLCCSAQNTTLSSSCTAPNSGKVINLADESNSHVEEANMTNYDIPICLSALNKSVSCSYKSQCSPTESCLFSISSETNAHVGVCDYYPIRVCCSLS